MTYCMLLTMLVSTHSSGVKKSRKSFIRCGQGFSSVSTSLNIWAKEDVGIHSCWYVAVLTLLDSHLSFLAFKSASRNFWYTSSLWSLVSVVWAQRKKITLRKRKIVGVRMLQACAGLYSVIPYEWRDSHLELFHFLCCTMVLWHKLL